MAQQISTNTFGTARYVVSNDPTQGTHTTIQSAITAAELTGFNQTVFIRPKTDGTAYSENLTLKAGVNLTAFQCDALTPNVTISGTCTFTAAGTVTISGIRLASNGAEFLSVTGTAASIVNLNNCYLTTAFDPGITFSSTSASAAININYCSGDITVLARRFFNHSSAGNLTIEYTRILNSISSTTASTCSAGTVTLRHANLTFPITTSATGVLIAKHCTFGTATFNTTALTIGGTTALVIHSEITSGTASAISVGSALTLNDCTVTSSNTNAITGAGGLIYSGLFFNSSSSKINTTTQSGGTIQGGVAQAPSAGFIGERVEATGTSVAVTSNVAKTICSITLTPGVWDISGMGFTVATGGTAVAQAMQVNISTTDNTITGTAGIDYAQNNASTNFVINSLSVPSVRKTITANTTYYLVMLVVYTSTTSPCNARISATRVG